MSLFASLVCVCLVHLRARQARLRSIGHKTNLCSPPSLPNLGPQLELELELALGGSRQSGVAAKLSRWLEIIAI